MQEARNSSMTFLPELYDHPAEHYTHPLHHLHQVQRNQSQEVSYELF